jgi:hypothetical protein
MSSERGLGEGQAFARAGYETGGKHAETRALCAVPLTFASSIDIIFV